MRPITLSLVMGGLLGACASNPQADDQAAISLPADQVSVPPQLVIGGECPGVVELSVQGATPGGNIAVVSGTAGGTTPIPGGPCEGVPLDLANPTLRRIDAASQGGTWSLSPELGAGPCSQHVQIVDLMTCTVSTAEPLTGSILPEPLPDGEFGDTTIATVGGPYFRGNTFIATQEGWLDSFELLLDLPTSCTVDFAVYSNTGRGGTWAEEARNTITYVPNPFGLSTDTGPAFVSSGVIDLYLEYGQTYVIGAGWDCDDMTIYSGEAISWPDTAFGSFVGLSLDDDYSAGAPSLITSTGGFGQALSQNFEFYPYVPVP